MTAFHSLTERLRVSLGEHVAVHTHLNPVLQNLSIFDAVQLTSILQQYSILPGALVVFLAAVRDRAASAGWEIAAQELDKNLAEEMGSKTEGVPHADLLAEGLELCLNVPIKTAIPSTATVAFRERLVGMTEQPIAYLFGAAYAIEATAVPELTIITQLLDLLLEGAMPDRLRYFFEMHLNEWEPEHEAQLQQAIAAHLTSDQFNAFEIGFCAMLTTMDSWWSGLVAEALTGRRVSLEIC